MSHTTSPLLVPTLVSTVWPSTACESSSMNQAWADFGLTSGTPIGSAPALVSTCLTEMRAWALMKGTTGEPPPSRPATGLKYHGRSVSVSLTSIALAAHGVPVTVSSAAGDDGWL